MFNAFDKAILNVCSCKANVEFNYYGVVCFDEYTEADPGFFLGGGAPLRNGVTDW